jgi:hypothetical protein
MILGGMRAARVEQRHLHARLGFDSDWIVKVIDVYPDDLPDPKPNPAGVRSE